MAHVGMKRPYGAMLGDGGTYTDGFIIGKAINFTGTPSVTTQELYADDDLSETDRAMRNMSTSMGIDDISLKNQCTMLGHTYVEKSGDTPETMKVNSGDVAPFMGVGFYKRRRKNNQTTFTCIWLYKVQHAAMTETATTKGTNTEFQTDTITGTAYPLENGDTYDKAVVDTEAAAIAWIEKHVTG